MSGLVQCTSVCYLRERDAGKVRAGEISGMRSQAELEKAGQKVSCVAHSQNFQFINRFRASCSHGGEAWPHVHEDSSTSKNLSIGYKRWPYSSAVILSSRRDSLSTNCFDKFTSKRYLAIHFVLYIFCNETTEHAQIWEIQQAGIRNWVGWGCGVILYTRSHKFGQTGQEGSMRTR